MNKTVSDSNLVAYCGLYCGACKKYINAKCQGCHENDKASWCKIRTCCIDKNHSSCAQCKEYSDVNNCRKFNNVAAKVIGIIFQSNRKACISQISNKGLQKHAEIMAVNKMRTIKGK